MVIKIVSYFDSGNHIDNIFGTTAIQKLDMKQWKIPHNVGLKKSLLFINI